MKSKTSRYLGRTGLALLVVAAVGCSEARPLESLARTSDSLAGAKAKRSKSGAAARWFGHHHSSLGPAWGATAKVVGDSSLTKVVYKTQVQTLATSSFWSPAIELGSVARQGSCYPMPGFATPGTAEVGLEVVYSRRGSEASTLPLEAESSEGSIDYSGGAIDTSLAPEGSRWDVQLGHPLAPFATAPSSAGSPVTFVDVLRVPARFQPLTLAGPDGAMHLTKGEAFELRWDGSSDIDNVSLLLIDYEGDNSWACDSRNSGRLIVPATVVDSLPATGGWFLGAQRFEARPAANGAWFRFSGTTQIDLDFAVEPGASP